MGRAAKKVLGRPYSVAVQGVDVCTCACAQQGWESHLHNKDQSETDDVTDLKMYKSDCQDTNGIYTGREMLDSSAAVSLQIAAQERVPPSFKPRITLGAMIT